MSEVENMALLFIRNVAMTKTTEPNDIWSTIYHVAQDALDGHSQTMNELRGEDIDA